MSDSQLYRPTHGGYPKPRFRFKAPSKEWLLAMAEKENGQCISVGGLAVELGLYKAPAHFCGKPATCHGTYEGLTGYSCDDCCGHGCEDGYCEPVAQKPSQPLAAEQEDAADLAAVAASKAEGVFVPLDQALAEVDQPLAAGDWVVCVEGHSDYLISGKVYRIAVVDYWIYLDAEGDCRGGWHHKRFRRATPAEIEAASPKLHLREGGWYRRRDGQVVGPAKRGETDVDLPWYVGVYWYGNDGRWGPEHLDLIAEVPAPSWQPHDGGQCPVDASGKRVEGVYNGAHRPTPVALAETLDWSDIIAWRLAE